MTEKRFRLIDYEEDYFTVGDDKKGEEYDTPFKVIDVLNELNDENIELHIQNDFLKCESKHLQEVLKKNRELKTLVSFYKSFQKDARELEKENRQLKQQIKDLRTDVLNSIHKANGIECNCCPCVVEKCVKRVIE